MGELKGGERPFVSVICPVYNDPGGIRTTIRSLLAQKYPSDRFEIIIVDNDSTDHTRAVAAELCRHHEHATVVDETTTQSSYAARNTGIRYQTGELLAFVDSDVVVEPTWLSDLVAAFDRTEADYLGCRVESFLPEGGTTLVGRYNTVTNFPVKFYLERRQYAPTCALAVRRPVVEDVGPFDGRLVSGGDVEFGQRVASAGYTQTFAEDVVVYHPARTSFTNYLAKHFRIGRGKEQLFQLPDLETSSRPLLTLRNVLPPHPLTFRGRMRHRCSLVLFVVFYLIAYTGKLSTFGGRIRERLSTRHS